jgi:hypothetical protein
VEWVATAFHATWGQWVQEGVENKLSSRLIIALQLVTCLQGREKMSCP